MTIYIVAAGAVGSIVFSILFLLMLIKGNSLKIPFIGMAVFVILMAAGVVLTMLGGKEDSPDTADKVSQAAESQGVGDIQGTESDGRESIEPDVPDSLESFYITGTPVKDGPGENSSDGIWSNGFTSINDFTYTLDKSKKTVTLNRYRGRDKKIRLSPVYTIGGEDYALVSVGETACFLEKTSITSVYIPEGVTHISDNCFNSCASLKYLYIPSTVQSLGSAFFDYMHEYTAFCDSSANLPGERDENDYEEIVDDTSQAEELGRSLGGAANGFIAGFLSGSEGEITTEIYYGGTEAQWKSIAK